MENFLLENNENSCQSCNESTLVIKAVILLHAKFFVRRKKAPKGWLNSSVSTLTFAIDEQLSRSHLFVLHCFSSSNLNKLNLNI